MKKVLTALIAGLTLLCMTGLSHANLVTIGTAEYCGADYNLIWDDDNNGNSIVWLDYGGMSDIWSVQNDWADSLNTSLTYNIYSAYSVDWGTNLWRLPDTVDGPFVLGNDGTTTAGYNITSSEMGHLFYTELGNLGAFDTSGNTQVGYGLQNVGDFDNFTTSWYWSGMEYAVNPDKAWHFNMGDGRQSIDGKDYPMYSLAVRSGQVSAASVPEPATILLFGTGLAGIAALKRRKKGSCV